MAVRQLAGPFGIVDGSNNPIPSSVGFNPTYFNPSLWIPNFGYVMEYNGYICLMSLDGVVAEISANTIFQGSSLVPSVYDSISTKLKTFNPLNITTGQIVPESYRDKVCLCPQLDTAAKFTWVDFGSSNINYMGYDTANRRIIVNSEGLFYCPAGTVAKVGQPYPFTKPEFTGTMPWGSYWSGITMGPGRGSGEIFFGWPGASGILKGIFYNTTTKTFVSPVYILGIPGLAVVYASDWGVFLAIQGNGDTQPYTCSIFSLDVVPANVTAPVGQFLNENSGYVCTWGTQVQGADGDVCVGVLVDWSITGPAQLLSLQSMTDVNGNATTTVVYPLTGNGASVLTASVTC